MHTAALVYARAFIVLWGSCGILVPSAYAQTLNDRSTSAVQPWEEEGFPIIENFSTSLHGADARNWSVTRDRAGVLYVGNTEGILEFDGTYWYKIISANETPVFSLDVSNNGTVYFGLYKEFGRLVADSNGSNHMELLSSRLPSNQRDFERVSGVHCIGNIVWFRTDTRLFRWDGKQITSIRAKTFFERSFLVDGMLYVVVEGEGLHLVGTNKTSLVPGGEYLSDPDMNVAFVLPADNGRLLVGTWKLGMLFYDGKQFLPAWSPAVRANHPREPACGVLLADSTWAIGTRRRGIWILDREGRVRRVLDGVNGLQTNGVLGLLTDHEQMLWAALDNGLSRIEWPSDVTIYGRDSQLEGIILDVEYFQERLHVATTQGFFRMEYRPFQVSALRTKHSSFELDESGPAETMDLLDCGDQLLLVGGGGLYVYDGHRSRRIVNESGRILQKLHRSNDSVIVGTENEILLLTRNDGKWRSQPVFPSIKGMVISITEQSDGTLWFGMANGTIFSVANTPMFIHSRVREYTELSAQTVNGTDYNPVFIGEIHGKIWVWTEDTLCRYDAGKGTFLPDPEFWRGLGVPADWVVRMPYDDKQGRIWMQFFCPVRRYGYAEIGKGKDGKLTLLPELEREIAYFMRSVKDDIVWIGTESQLFRYLRVGPLRDNSFSVLIRSMVHNGVTDHYSRKAENDNPMELEYSDKGIEIRVAAASFIRNDLIEYRWKLVGDRDSWSDWSYQTAIDFPALSEGSYTFHVEARRADGTISDQASLHFRVLPPWQRSWWAYALYFLAATGIFLVALRYRTRKLEERSRDLELTVQERTEEIISQAAKIRSQADELETLDSIVRTVNKEVHLTDLLSALLKQTLLLFPHVDVACYFQRNAEDGLFRLVATVGISLDYIEAHAFSLAELIDDPSNSIQSIQDGVYVLRGLEKHWNLHEESLLSRQKAFMGMSDMQHGVLRGFLVLGSERMQNFSADDLRRLLRLREHVSSAVAKAVAIRELENKNALLDNSNRQLRDTQQQLIVHEKLAALGELTAGIAHEIQNPLNFVNNFSSLSLELLDELEEGISRTFDGDDPPMLNLIATVRGNCERIREHGMRATSIVSAMLMHTRKGSARREAIPFNEFLDQFVMLSYHGMRMLHPQYELKLHTEYDRSIEHVQLSPQEMSRVIVNVCNNAWEAAIAKVGSSDVAMYPEVTVRSLNSGDTVRILVRDNGVGIPDELKGKIFEPFFTTKRSGNNAGLGLSMSYEIVTQMHKGTLSVETEPDHFSEFVIEIPKE